MKRALISPEERVTAYDGSQGARVAQVVNVGEEFGVGGQLFWTDCPDECIQDAWYYVGNSVAIIPVLPVELPPETYIDGATTGTQPILIPEEQQIRL